MSLPEWLDEAFLSKSLQGGDHKGSQIRVVNFESTPAAPSGTYYASCVLRVRVAYVENFKNEQHFLSLIIKFPHSAGRLKLQSLHQVEPVFYSQFLPHVNTLTKVSFAPKPYFSSIPSVLVLEDLSVQGYKVADRCKLLDFHHCRLYATAAATFHATSVAVGKKNPELIRTIGAEKFYTEGPIAEFYRIGIRDGIQCFADQMEKSHLKMYANLVRNTIPTLWEKVCEVHKQSTIFNCLNQGDPWMTNMMFKYNGTGEVVDIKLLDFQALRYGSPIDDLLFFLWTSADHDVRENRLDDFLYIYCDALNDKLQEMGCFENFTFDDALQGLRIHAPASLLFAAVTAPLLLYPGVIDFFEIAKDLTSNGNGERVNKLAKYYTEDFCRNHVPRILKQLFGLGVFHYLKNMESNYFLQNRTYTNSF
ncbi:hypothetical protein J6590_041873 [Homalodisca vitripennis]|nr:hypothetical protein J6590_041873 [Homalodisca vitripennis]